jgi:hypothetical protein
MRVKHEFAEAQRRFGLLGFYDMFEHIVILILTALIAVFIVFAVWNLALKIFLSIASSTFDPTDYAVFQAVQAVAARGCRAAAQRRPGSYRGLDCNACNPAQAADPRHWTRNGGIVRPCSGNNRAWGRLLACARPGLIRVEGAACRWGGAPSQFVHNNR